MKKVYLVIATAMVVSWSYAQNLKPIAEKVSERKSQQALFKPLQLFNVSDAAIQRNAQLPNTVSGATVLEFRKNATREIVITQPENLLFVIPVSGEKNIELELFRSDIFTSDFTVITSSNNLPFTYEGGVHYWGIIKGNNSSIAAISIFSDEIMGMISSSEGNFVLGKLENDTQGNHILYNDRNLPAPQNMQCFTDDNGVEYQPKDLQNPSSLLMVNCIRLYWEVNFDIYQQKGSVTNATNYVTGLFNQSAIIYTNDNIPVELSQVYVWNTASPYTSTSTSGLLNQFQSFRNSFNGDLGHLLGYAGGGGIAAGTNGLCNSNTDSKQCYSGISSSYQNFPTYSWSVMVVTHEQGHLLGSPHTHWCGWSGGPIDNCNTCWGLSTEGGCANGPSVSSGTIMSYCHGCSVGINFNNGFGTQPKNAILNKYNAASCLVACGGIPCTDNFEPNNTSQTSTLITLNSDVVAKISPQGDVDLFKFNNTGTQRNIMVTLTNLPANYNLKLLKNGVTLGSSTNGGTTPETIIYNTSTVGTYRAKVYGANGANSSTQCYTIKVQISQSPFRFGNLDDDDAATESDQNEIRIYPNPANEILNVLIPALEKASAKISIMDQLGREVAGFNIENSIASNHVQFELDKFSNGIYFVRVVQGNNIVTEKIMIVH